MKNGKIKKNKARYVPFIIPKEWSVAKFFNLKNKNVRSLKDDEQ